ncbi:MAG: hypothetical protein Q7U74_11855 [Saprospiraceae bacterium]|nr:hypothetical protein [Saprospiraceae bacterium]
MKRQVLVFALIITLTALSPLNQVLAARGTPGSAEFGYGAHFNLDGAFAIDAVRLASNLQLDWLAVDLSWQSVAPKAGAVDWSRIDPVLQVASNKQQAVMISLTEAPDWVQTPQGPDANLTAQFVLQLVQRYPKSIQAVELFSGANTRQGWGRQPNPQAYQKTWSSVQTTLQNSKINILLIAGGLRPVVSGTSASEAMDDLAFLQALYTAGGKNPVKIVSIQANDLTGDPLMAADKAENRVLRHYEEVRSVMLKNKQDASLVWITRLSPPTGAISVDDQKYQDLSNQSNWLNQAFGQLKSQLYIGVAFMNGINPSQTPNTAISLILPGEDYHPFYRSLRDLITINRSDNSTNRPGRAKDQPLQKSIK